MVEGKISVRIQGSGNEKFVPHSVKHDPFVKNLKNIGAENMTKRHKSSRKPAFFQSERNFFAPPLAAGVKTTLILWHFLRQLKHP